MRGPGCDRPLCSFVLTSQVVGKRPPSVVSLCRVLKKAFFKLVPGITWCPVISFEVKSIVTLLCHILTQPAVRWTWTCRRGAWPAVWGGAHRSAVVARACGGRF